MTLTSAQRTTVRLAIDKAKRAQLEQAGIPRLGPRKVEDPPHTEDPRVVELERQVARLQGTIRKLRANRDMWRKRATGRNPPPPRRGWWHAKARELSAAGVSYAEIGRRFGVDRTTAAYACGARKNSPRAVGKTSTGAGWSKTDSEARLVA